MPHLYTENGMENTKLWSRRVLGASLAAKWSRSVNASARKIYSIECTFQFFFQLHNFSLVFSFEQQHRHDVRQNQRKVVFRMETCIVCAARDQSTLKHTHIVYSLTLTEYSRIDVRIFEIRYFSCAVQRRRLMRRNKTNKNR